MEDIHYSLVNGQRKQAVLYIDDYGLYDFWADYRDYLSENVPVNDARKYFEDMAISYFRIKNR